MTMLMRWMLLIVGLLMKSIAPLKRLVCSYVLDEYMLLNDGGEPRCYGKTIQLVMLPKDKVALQIQLVCIIYKYC